MIIEDNHEADYFKADNEKLKAEIANLNKQINRQLTDRSRLTFRCKCGEEINTSPIPMYEAQIASLKARLASKCEMHVEYDSAPDKLIGELKASLEKAKEALERIAYGEPHGGDNTDDTPFIAKDALTDITTLLGSKGEK